MKPLERAWRDLGKPEQMLANNEVFKPVCTGGYVLIFRRDEHGRWIVWDWFKEVTDADH